MTRIHVTQSHCVKRPFMTVNIFIGARLIVSCVQTAPELPLFETMLVYYQLEPGAWRGEFGWNLNQSTAIFIQENEFENVSKMTTILPATFIQENEFENVSKMTTILPGSQCINGGHNVSLRIFLWPFTLKAYPFLLEFSWSHILMTKRFITRGGNCNSHVILTPPPPVSSNLVPREISTLTQNERSSAVPALHVHHHAQSSAHVSYFNFMTHSNYPSREHYLFPSSELNSGFTYNTTPCD